MLWNSHFSPHFYLAFSIILMIIKLELAGFTFGNIGDAIKKFEKRQTGLDIKEH